MTFRDSVYSIVHLQRLEDQFHFYGTGVFIFRPYRSNPDLHDLTIIEEIVNCSSTVKDITWWFYVHGSSYYCGMQICILSIA